MQDYDLICIGSGPAGEKAATQASWFKRRVAVVEAATTPGGAMVNTGTVPSKALRETALLFSGLHRRGLPGQATAIDHGLSVPRFMAHRHLIEQQEHDRIEASFDRHGIDVFVGRGSLLDANTVAVERRDGGESVIRGRFILVATGSSPLRPDHVPFDHPAVVDADGVLELEHLPRSMVIVGGGVIGCEYASIFAEIDVKVTLVHPRPEVLGFVDAECRDRLVQAMRDKGVDVRLEAMVERVEATGQEGRVRVTLKDGGELSADCLLWAAGRRSNTTGIGLEAAGVEVGERGLIKVDEGYRTNVPSIYAAGDVIGFPALAATSMEQGRIAACHMFGQDFKAALASIMPLGIYTIPAISSVGLGAGEATEQGHDALVGRALYRNNARGRMLGDGRGLLKCTFDRATRALLGATIVGEQATELIHLAGCMIGQGQGIDALIDACFNYPSLSELYKYAAYDALQQLAVDGNQTEAASAKVA